MSLFRPRTLFRAAALAAAFVVAVPLVASAATVRGLRTSKLVEMQGAGAPGVLAWAQNSTAHPNHIDYFVRVGTTSPRKVNASGTQAFGGGIDGDTLIFQQVHGTDSDIKLWDITGHTRSNPPAKVNTDRWEFWPTKSGSRILFGRFFPGTGAYQVVVVDSDAGTSTILDKIKGKGTFAAPGQVNGDFVSWQKCGPAIECQVFFQDLSADGNPVKVPNPGKYQYASSITSEGTVFFGRSGHDCGANVKLMSFHEGGSPKTIVDLADGVDFGDTYTFESGGKTRVLFDRVKCSTQDSDIFQASLG